MLIFLALALQVRAAAPPPPMPQRAVPDPGVIATDQRVTPAGVQSVFRGRVSGVRFGTTSAELWVAAPGGAYRMNWRDNRVIAHGAYDGRPGVQGITFDAVPNSVLSASHLSLKQPGTSAFRPSAMAFSTASISST